MILTNRQLGVLMMTMTTFMDRKMVGARGIGRLGEVDVGKGGGIVFIVMTEGVRQGKGGFMRDGWVLLHMDALAVILNLHTLQPTVPSKPFSVINLSHFLCLNYKQYIPFALDHTPDKQIYTLSPLRSQSSPNVKPSSRPCAQSPVSLTPHFLLSPTPSPPPHAPT